MTSNHIGKKDALSLIFKDILCLQSFSKHISPILHIFNSQENIPLSKSNQSPKLYKIYFLGD